LNWRGASFSDDDVDFGVPQIPAKAVENQAVAPASIQDEKKMNKGTDHFKNQDKLAEIPSDSAAESIDVKSREVQSALLEKKNAVEEKRRKVGDCYTWHQRLGHPNRADMKRRVAEMPEDCGVTVADVDELPWMPGDRILDVIRINNHILGRD
jgi:hypothetical protein